MNEDLREALSAIEGVERSEVESTDNGPLAIRVRLERGADRIAVAEDVQRLLEAHGLRSRVAPDRREPGPDVPPPPPAEPQRPPSPSRAPAPGRTRTAPEAPSTSNRSPTSQGVESVTVSETLEAFVVTVVADRGRSATRRARRTEQALSEAIVAAVGELVDPEALPSGLRAIEHSEGFPAMTVYLEGPDGGIQVGATLIAAGRHFALAQAVWAALQA